MTASPMEIATHHFTADDGADLVWHETGEGRPVVLIHGLFSDAATNWVKYGAAAEVVARGFRLIMPDLRAHGESARPHDHSAYPGDVLAGDGFALIRHLGLERSEEHTSELQSLMRSSFAVFFLYKKQSK